MNINQKIYFYIDSCTSTDQLFALLDTAQSGNENEIDKLMNDPDMESLAPEEIQLNGNPNNSSLLTPETNANVVDEGTTHTKEL